MKQINMKLVSSFMAISNVSLKVIFLFATVRTVATLQLRNLPTFETKVR